MKDTRVSLLTVWCVFVAILSVVQNANAMVGEYGKGDPKHPMSNSAWPEGLAAVANRVDRIGGYWVNSNDTFYYAGSAADFNNFLAAYSKVKCKPLTLIIENASSSPRLFQPADPQTDWQLSMAGWSVSNVSLTMPLHGRIALKDLKVPLSIDIDLCGDKDAAAIAFVATHKAAQSKAHRTKLVK